MSSLDNLSQNGANHGSERNHPDAPNALLSLAIPLAMSWKLLIFGPLFCGAVAYGLTFLIQPTFTARVSVIPPQQQGAAASTLASLGALSALTGASTRTLADQYAALLQSETVEDALIDRFKLMDAYGTKFRVDARRQLEQNVRVSSGKKDGLIIVEVDDTSPTRASEIANQHIEQLRQLTSKLALTEAQQRRVFFQNQLAETRERLTKAQAALQATGFNAGALRTEPRAAAESYARIRAEISANEVKMQAFRRNLTESAPEIQQLQAATVALRSQLAQVESSSKTVDGPDYVSRYREFKYQEALFELFARQYEASRLDESRDGALIQVVDAATVPERKSKPKRAVISLSAAFLSLLLLTAFAMLRSSWKEAATGEQHAANLRRLKLALKGG